MAGKYSCYIGYDPRELDAFVVARESFITNCFFPIQLEAIALFDLLEYTREHERRNGQLYDSISCAPMSTEFAISRFFTPILAETGLALFMDSDVLVRSSVSPLYRIAEADSSKAVWVVPHSMNITHGLKMDNQLQIVYPRKNWSSVMMFNCDHPANKRLTVDMINTLPGRDLHNFCWLDDDEIGFLDPTYNYLVGHTSGVDDPVIVHYTDGIPSMRGYEDCEYANEWRECLNRFIRYADTT
jgi:lipopolysaccharide biosynthesis glycosyltransferase